MATPYGLELLRRLRLFEPPDGMWANLGMRITEAEESSTVVEGDFSREAHGRAAEIHRGAVAAVADGATACAGATLAAEGEIATAVELLRDFFRRAPPCRALATGSAPHRPRLLVYWTATAAR